VLVATKGGHIGPGDGSWTVNGSPAHLREAAEASLKALSNASVGQIDTARRILGDGKLASVQNQFSPAFRSSEGELRHCAELGITFLPWSPLGGIGQAGDLGARHAAFQEIADARGVSPQQVTLAWILALAPVVIPIPGASRPASITDSAQAADLVLTQEEIGRLSAA
jgi:aryl-alcohol dehydrogenase-like predicted oxidoreductase